MLIQNVIHIFVCIFFFFLSQVFHKRRKLETCNGGIVGRGKEDGRSAEEDHSRSLGATRGNLIWISNLRASKEDAMGGNRKQEQTWRHFRWNPGGKLSGSWSTTTRTCTEVGTYLSEPTVWHSNNSLLYWKKPSQPRLPSRVITATKFLCGPSASVASERLFSTTSVVIDGWRSSLTANLPKEQTLVTYWLYNNKTSLLYCTWKSHVPACAAYPYPCTVVWLLARCCDR